MTTTTRQLTLFCLMIAAHGWNLAGIQASIISCVEPPIATQITPHASASSFSTYIVDRRDDYRPKRAADFDSMELNASTLVHTISWQVGIGSGDITPENEDTIETRGMLANNFISNDDSEPLRYWRREPTMFEETWALEYSL